MGKQQPALLGGLFIGVLSALPGVSIGNCCCCLWVVTGGLLATAVAASDRLRPTGISVRVLSMHTTKPVDDAEIVAAAQETRGIVTLEEHSVIGGLGSAVAEILAESPEGKVPFKRLGLPSAFATEIGSQDYLRRAYRLSEEAVADSIEQLLRAT